MCLGIPDQTAEIVEDEKSWRKLMWRVPNAESTPLTF